MRWHLLRLILFAFSSIYASIGAAHAIVRLQVEQIGPNVVITGSGSANTLGLTSLGSNFDWTNTLSDIQIFAGPDAFGDGSGAGGDVSVWSSITGPSTLGIPIGNFLPDSGIGDLFGIITDFVSPAPQLILPHSYSSGSALNGTTTFFNQTLSSLGFTPGTSSTWNWGSGGDADSLVLEVQVPAPLPILGAALALAQSRRLRRRIKASSS
jgi:hypothetical protein